MFSIDERNKIYLTKGDTTSFTLTIEDATGSPYEIKEGDILTFSIDDTDFSIEAENKDTYAEFTFRGNETEELEAGVYTYRIIFTAEGEKYTIFQDEFIEILGDGTKEEPTPEPQPDPEPQPEPEPEPEPEPVVTYTATIDNPTTTVRESVDVHLDITPEITRVAMDIEWDDNCVTVLNAPEITGGLGNVSWRNTTSHSIHLEDYISTSGDALASYTIKFDTWFAGTGYVNVSNITVQDLNGDTYNLEDVSSEVTVQEAL